MRVLRDLTLLPFESDTIAFSEEAQLLLHLNPAAAAVVGELQKGAGVAEAAHVLASLGLVAPEQAAQWVEATVDALRSHGMLANGPTPPQPPAANPAPDEAAGTLPYTPFEPAFEQRYRLLETCALIRFGHRAQARQVNSVIGHLAVNEPCAPTIIIELKAKRVDPVTMHSDVYCDQVPVGCAPKLPRLAPIVKALLWHSAISAHDFLFYIHAGVVGIDRSCVLLPAAAGSGKSSLTAALVHRGFRYFSDEVALIEPNTFHVAPMPLAMAVKSTGWELMARYHPRIGSLPIHLRTDAKLLRYLPPPAEAARQAPAPVSHIIFPRYDKDGPTRLERVRRPQALGRLMGECLGLRHRLDHDNVGRLISWISGLICYELTFSCLETAADLVTEVTGYRRQAGDMT